MGVTATPARLGGAGLGDVNDKLIIGVSAKWLIENHCLAPYDYYAPDVADLTQLKTRRGEYVTADIEKAMIKKAVFGDVIKYYKKLANGKKAICYCASVNHSKATAESFRAAGIAAAHIDGDTPKELRSAIIGKFRDGEITVLCNVDLISEGFDVPDCECAILLRPTQSLTLYIQQSMRAMRYRENKHAVIIDHVGNYARFGLPDDDREWTLEGKPKTRKKQTEEDVKVKQCPECFYTFVPPEEKDSPLVCPNCGYEFPKKERREIKTESAELQKIEGFKLDTQTPSDCRSYRELLDYAKRHNYKPGWAYYQAKERGLIERSS
ncbi:MAG: helicase [Oscillospiraceae bacterium]|nr:helicase [Oscillospiraceae bacterium]